MRVAIRADASPAIGSGHIRRTMALAGALQARGAGIVYVTRGAIGDLRDELTGAGFRVHASLEEAGAQDGLIVDHYELTAEWERRAHTRARRICAIDDLGREHYCDVLLDQNLGADAQRYTAKLPGTARLLLGLRYALLREEFRRYVDAPPSTRTTVQRILVSLGGFDATNETGKVLEALAGLGEKNLRVDVVLPISAPHAPAVEEQCRREGFTYHGRGAAMAQLMARADLAIGAMGSTAWERCLLGLPAVVVTLAENQRAGASACERAGAAIWLGDSMQVDAAKIRDVVRKLVDDSASLRRLSEAARRASCADDGFFSTDRAADAIMEVFNA